MEKISEIKKIRSIDCGKEFLIYNGKSFIRLAVVREMIGLRFQDFVLTKKVGRYIHDKSTKGKEANKKKKKK